jgi:hypothetical protein
VFRLSALQAMQGFWGEQVFFLNGMSVMLIAAVRR